MKQIYCKITRIAAKNGEKLRESQQKEPYKHIQSADAFFVVLFRLSFSIYVSLSLFLLIWKPNIEFLLCLDRSLFSFQIINYQQCIDGIVECHSPIIRSLIWFCVYGIHWSSKTVSSPFVFNVITYGSSLINIWFQVIEFFLLQTRAPPTFFQYETNTIPRIELFFSFFIIQVVQIRAINYIIRNLFISFNPIKIYFELRKKVLMPFDFK